MSHYDFLVVGHGLAGAVLSNQLLEKGYSVLVIDNFRKDSSSQVAAGLVNPITGRRVVKSWMADTLIPFAEKYYSDLENKFRTRFYYPIDVLEVVGSAKEANEWMSRTSDDEMKKYLSSTAPEENYKEALFDFKKMFRIGSSAWMNIPVFIDGCLKQLKSAGRVLDESFRVEELSIMKDEVRYASNNENGNGNVNVIANKIIFCEGVYALKNPLWNWIPLVPAKGEILTIKCKSLPENFILMSGLFFIPLGDHLFRVGSTYEWQFKDESPTEQGKQKLTDLIAKFLRLPFSIVDHRAGIRPTVKDRRPLIGHHPDHENVLIFNGLGTKGVQLAPYFADHFIAYMEGKVELMSEVDINR